LHVDIFSKRRFSSDEQIEFTLLECIACNLWLCKNDIGIATGLSGQIYGPCEWDTLLSSSHIDTIKYNDDEWELEEETLYYLP